MKKQILLTIALALSASSLVSMQTSNDPKTHTDKSKIPAKFLKILNGAAGDPRKEKAALAAIYNQQPTDLSVEERIKDALAKVDQEQEGRMEEVD